MSGARLWDLLCDYEKEEGGQCSESYGAFTTLSEARREAKELGWSVNQPGGQDFCPEHSPVLS